MPPGRIAAIAPAVFVVLWSTGFVFAREGVTYADPATLLSIRFALAAALLAAIAVATRAPWPNRHDTLHAIAAGLLLQAVYAGGVFAAVDNHLAAGITALVVGIQPALSAFLAQPLLKERVTRLQWCGIALGFAGVVLVVERKVTFDDGATRGLLFAVMALLAITVGTIYQRRYSRGTDLRTGAAWQFGVSAAAMAVAAAVFEPMHIEWTWQLSGSLAYMAVILSAGTVTGYLWLIRRLEVARVTSYFYLVPPITALLAWPWFGETVTVGMAVGMAIAAAGVFLVQRGAAQQR
jgi:drug/metabolite transporter (DMT)-like permease